MLIIRLQRAGKRNQPLYRVIVAEKTASASKKFIEVLGSYNPHTKNLVMKADRLEYWKGQQISMSPTVHNLFVTKKMVDGKKVSAFKLPKKEAAKEEVAAPVVEVPAEAVAA